MLTEDNGKDHNICKYVRMSAQCSQKIMGRITRSVNTSECLHNVDRRREGSQDLSNGNEKQKTTNRLKLESKRMLELNKKLINFDIIVI
jgi:hypothetical protein